MRRQKFGTSVTDIHSRLSRVEKAPAHNSIANKTVTGAKLVARTIPTKAIAVNAVTPAEVNFGTTVVAVTPPTDPNIVKDGLTVVHPTTGGTQVYSADTTSYVDVTDPAAASAALAAAVAAVAAAADAASAAVTAGAAAAAALVSQATADGKNKVYHQTTAPTGGTYATGDLWFDTSNDNKMYRYATPASLTVSNKALTSNVATLTTSTAHGLSMGDVITVASVDATFNGTFTVTAVPTTTILAYNVTHADVTSTSSSGTITTTAWRAVVFSTNALGVIDASVVNVSNLNAGNISAGYIASARIAAGTILASQIAAGTITATQISAGYVYAGTLNASQINAASIIATVFLTSPIISGGTIIGGLIETASGSVQKVQISGSNNAIQYTNSSGTVVANISPLLYGSYGLILNVGSTPDSTFSQTDASIYLISGEARVSYGGYSGNYISVNSIGTSIQGGSLGVKLGGTLTPSSTPSGIVMYGSLGNLYKTSLTVQSTSAGTPSGGNPGDIWLQY